MSDTSELRERIDAQLRRVIDPCSAASVDPMNILEMGLVREVRIDDGAVLIDLCLTSPSCLMMEHFVSEATRLIGSMTDVDSVEVRGDNGLFWTPGHIEKAAADRRQHRLNLLLSQPTPRVRESIK